MLAFRLLSANVERPFGTAMAIRQGIWRFTFILWALGAILLLVLPAEPIFLPYDNICVDRPGPAYPECYSKEARELEKTIAKSDLEDVFRAMQNDDYQKINTSRHVRRVDTESYQSALRFLAGLELAWAVFVWSLFYLVIWVVSGFRGRA